MSEKEFIMYLEKDNIEVNSEKLKQLNRYYELLIEWNQKMNLTAITDKKEVYLKHFYDSLTLNRGIDLKNIHTLCDIGSGAGFPGLVIKIFFPDIEVTLVDAQEKRVTFLNTVIENLNLQKIHVYHERAEDYARKVREKYEVVTARAVSNLSLLAEYCLPLVKCGYYFLPMKGKIKEELQNSNKAISLLGGSLVEKFEFSLPFEESTRTILKIKKIVSTPLKYPRKFSEMKKNPL